MSSEANLFKSDEKNTNAVSPYYNMYILSSIEWFLCGLFGAHLLFNSMPIETNSYGEFRVPIPNWLHSVGIRQHLIFRNSEIFTKGS